MDIHYCREKVVDLSMHVLDRIPYGPAVISRIAVKLFFVAVVPGKNKEKKVYSHINIKMPLIFWNFELNSRGNL